MPQPPANGSLQHKVSCSKPAGSVQTCVAQVNLLPLAVLAEEALPAGLLPPPHADNTVTNPNANRHVHCFIGFTCRRHDRRLGPDTSPQAMLGAEL
jgi:hypothetical protein